LQTSFQLGEILKLATENGITLKVSREEFISRILSACHKQEVAAHGEGFWSDHWTYTLDLLESYYALYPEEMKNLLLEKKEFSFFFNSHILLPREERYLLTKNGVRQYHSVRNVPREIHADQKGNKLRIGNGEGDVYLSSLLVKLLCLITNKAATFDPSGLGIEMEADKPNWCDALNGLPGLLGSSLAETLEVKRFCLFLLDTLSRLGLGKGDKVKVYDELAEFFTALKQILSQEKNALTYWQRSNDAKEAYRAKVKEGINGEEKDIFINDIKDFLSFIIARVDASVEKARESSGGILPTYFYHEVTEYTVLDKQHKGLNHVTPKKFALRVLPYFLEGFVHALRVERDEKIARRIHDQVRKTEIYDRKLKFYKINEDLSRETEEIGRIRIFPRGWLENESVWLHMEYKYLLELLRSGLSKEFCDTFKEVLVPFLKPECYGRSTLENSSFIVSSAHEDKGLHGQGYVARLSGSTAEFIHIWLMMNIGKKPFHLDARDRLSLSLKPILPGWLFTRRDQEIEMTDTAGQEKKIFVPKNSYAFNLFGKTIVIYHNPKRLDTFGEVRGYIKKIQINYDGKKPAAIINDSVVPSPYAQEIRDRQVAQIDVYFE